jgi:hypothetical protein
MYCILQIAVPKVELHEEILIGSGNLDKVCTQLWWKTLASESIHKSGPHDPRKYELSKSLNAD